MDKIQVIENLFNFTFQYSFLLPICIFLLFYKQIRSQKVCWVIFTYSILFFLLNYFFHSIPRDYKPAYYTIYTLLEYSSFASILWLQIENKSFKKFVVIFSSFFFLFAIIYSLTNKWKFLDSVPIGVETILIFIFISLVFYEQLRNAKNQYVYNSSWFWLIIGIMIYLAGSFFFYILVNNIDKKIVSNYWFITYIFDTLKNISFCIAILVLIRNRKKNSQSSSTIPYLDMI